MTTDNTKNQNIALAMSRSGLLRVEFKDKTSPSRAWLRLNAFPVLACLPGCLPACLPSCLLTFLLNCLPEYIYKGQMSVWPYMYIIRDHYSVKENTEPDIDIDVLFG